MLTEGKLLARRERFVEVFEGLWGEIGWNLHKCKTEADVIRALHPLNGIAFIRELASVFFAESRAQVSPAAVRKVRAELHVVQKNWLPAEDFKQRALEDLHRVDDVLAWAPSKERRALKREQKKRRKDALRRIQEWQELSRLEKLLKVQLRGLEAGFARLEILRFCKSRRYEMNPLNLANAVAGLPDMGWRQSMRRCSKKRADALDYQIFKAIRFIAINAKKNSAEVFVAEFRENVPRLPSRYRAARDELAKQWLFLERALKLAFRSKPHPSAFPFEISKHYFKQIRSRSQVDRILAQQAELTLKGDKKGVTC